MEFNNISHPQAGFTRWNMKYFILNRVFLYEQLKRDTLSVSHEKSEFFCLAPLLCSPQAPISWKIYYLFDILFFHMRVKLFMRYNVTHWCVCQIQLSQRMFKFHRAARQPNIFPWCLVNFTFHKLTSAQNIE